MGELFEIVVFTASLSKVSHSYFFPIYAAAYRPLYSMRTLYWTSLTFTRWSLTGYSVKAATIIRATTSRLVLGISISKWAEIVDPGFVTIRTATDRDDNSGQLAGVVHFPP
jgi:hypothetical protein